MNPTKCTQEQFRTFVMSRVELNRRLPHTYCRACRYKLDCIEDVTPKSCPLDLKGGGDAA